MRNKLRYFGSLILFSIFIINIVISIPDFDISTVYGGSDTFTISHTYNDAFETGSGVTSTTAQHDDMRTDSTPSSLDYKCSGLMFDSVEIPEGVTITSAELNIYVATSDDDIDINIFGNDVDDALDFVDDPDIIHTRTRTSASVNWDESSLGNPTWATSPDITTVIQEIVDREGWESGNNLALLLISETEETAQWCKLADYEYSGAGFPAYLDVEWDDPPPSGIVYPDHVESADHVTNATHSLDNNGTFAILEHDATIIWDFGGEAVANITAIRWELLHSVTGALWRLEGTDDLGGSPDWEIIAQMKQSEVADPVGTNKNDSIRWDWNIVTPYRYLKISAIKTVLSDYYIDYICYVIAPPEIDYSEGDYIYPYEVESWNWEINGMGIGDTNYASRPTNMVGKNMGGNGANQSQICWVVNSDFDPDNMAVVKFGDYYNITSIEVRLNLLGSPQHAYLYVSSDGVDWDLVWNYGGYRAMDWYGDTNYNASFIRYAKLNSTAVGTNVVILDAFRIKGEVSGTSPPEDDDDGDFELPSFGNLPEWFALALGIEVFGAGILLSGIILMMFLLPIVWYGKSSLAVMIVGLVLVGFLVTINWLPTWMILIIMLLIAGMYASKIGDWLSPQGKK